LSVAFRRALVAAAAAPYRSAGRFAWHFARAKLAHDPVFAGLLQRGLIPDARCLVDLGCGQGLLASWLRSAWTFHEGGHWPADWPPPPDIGRIVGIESAPREVARARRALAGRGEFEQDDIRTAGFGRADVIVILDVLHYLDAAEQVLLLRRVRVALMPDGLLLTRIGDAGAGLRFQLGRLVDHAVSSLRGHPRPRPGFRSTAEWTALLEDVGFRVQAMTMSRRTPFANVLLVARAAGAPI
jgi:trans-aconitate methyltransferase